VTGAPGTEIPCVQHPTFLAPGVADQILDEEQGLEIAELDGDRPMIGRANVTEWPFGVDVVAHAFHHSSIDEVGDDLVGQEISLCA
jgi:hypothetical protein